MTTIHEPDRHLVQWVYVSTAARVYDGADLDALLDEAVRNNLRRGLTGMLLYADSGFMQALECECAAVEDLMATIRSDSRHRDILDLCFSTISERAFADGSMGFHRLTPADMAHPQYVAFSDIGHWSGSERGDHASRLLHSFARDSSGAT